MEMPHFHTVVGTDREIPTLEIIKHRYKNILNLLNLHQLSNLAAMFVVWEQFEHFYLRVCQEIHTRIQKTDHRKMEWTEDAPGYEENSEI